MMRLDKLAQCMPIDELLHDHRHRVGTLQVFDRLVKLRHALDIDRRKHLRLAMKQFIHLPVLHRLDMHDFNRNLGAIRSTTSPINLPLATLPHAL